MDFAEGIYFDLPEDDYFSVQALSASGIKTLRCSPLDYWARNIDPNYEPDTEESTAKKIGRAFDRRITEGKPAFDATYAPAIDPADYPNALRTIDEIKDRLRTFKERGIDVHLTAKNKDGYIDNLLSVDPTAQLWDAIVDKYVKEHAGREFLSGDLIRSIEVAAAHIEKHPTLSKAFTGGAAQVSIFWECPTIGIRCKARPDYLKPRAIVDLKTFANKFQRPIDVAIARELSANKYQNQAAWYYEAADQVARLISEGKVYGEVSHELRQGLAQGYEKTFLFIFQQKGIAPLARGKIFLRRLNNCEVAAAQNESAKQIYRQCWDKFGSDPWIDDSPITELNDEELPVWAE